MRTLLLACAMLASPLVHADTSTGAKPAAAELLVSFHTMIGAPPPEDYVIDVRSDGKVEVTVYQTFKRKAGGAVEFLDLKKKPRVHSRTVPAADLDPLRKLLKSADLATLKSEYKGSTWDVGSYSFSLPDAAGKMRTVSTSMLAVGELPPVLRQIIGEARKLAGNLYRTP